MKSIINTKSALFCFFFFAQIQINVTYANTFTLQPLGERLNQCYKKWNPLRTIEICSDIENNIIIDFEPKINIANDINVKNNFSSVISNNNCFFVQTPKEVYRSLNNLIYFHYYCKTSETALAVYEFGFYEKFKTVALHEVNYLTCSHDNWSQLQKALMDKFMNKGAKFEIWNNLPKSSYSSKDRGTDTIYFSREESPESLTVYVDYSKNDHLKCPENVKLSFYLRPFSDNFPSVKNPYLNALESLKKEQTQINSSSQKPIF